MLRSMPVRFLNAIEALRLLESAQRGECAVQVQFLDLNQSLCIQARQLVCSDRTTERPLGRHALCLHMKACCILQILQVKFPSAAKLTTFTNFSAG